MLTVSDIHDDIIPAVVEQEWWSASITAFDDGDYEQAAALGRKLGNKARAIYNVAICYLLMGDDDSAVICEGLHVSNRGPRGLLLSAPSRPTHSFALPISKWRIFTTSWKTLNVP